MTMQTLEDRGRRALAHKDLAWLRAAVPSRFHGEPMIMADMLRAAAEGWPKLADEPYFAAAVATVRGWAAGQDLQNRLVKLYHDPAIRERMTRSPEEYWADPEMARRELIAASAENSRRFASGPLDEALTALSELSAFGETHNIEMPESAPIEKSIDAARLDDEIRGLITKGKLTPEEDARLDRLYEVRTARDEAAIERTIAAEPGAGRTRAPASISERPGAGPRDGEYRALIRKEKLTPDEDERLTQLVETRIEQETQEEFANGRDE